MTESIVPLKGPVIKGSKTKHEAYLTWRGMKRRCYYQENNRYHLYGGRGITVCERWFSFDIFVKDMGDKPSPKHSIDRIDVNGNYEPGNCRWASPNQQSLNQRPRGVTLYSIKCNNCNIVFHTKRGNNVRFCSKKCFADSIRGVTFKDKGINTNRTIYEHICKYCNKKFEYERKRKRVFCSKSCADDSRLKAPRVEFNCAQCGKPSKAPWSAAKNKINHCSFKCRKSGSYYKK